MPVAHFDPLGAALAPSAGVYVKPGQFRPGAGGNRGNAEGVKIRIDIMTSYIYSFTMKKTKLSETLRVESELLLRAATRRMRRNAKIIAAAQELLTFVENECVVDTIWGGDYSGQYKSEKFEEVISKLKEAFEERDRDE